jgi:hypothetical protein
MTTGRRWTFWLVPIAAILSFCAMDLALQAFSPVPHIREVADGLRDLDAVDPETIVVGSSHARTFHALSEELVRVAPSRPPMIAIPLEGGKLTGYEWLMEHRVLPLVDERGADGQPARRHLRRVIILTEWWDSCRLGRSERAWNIPARAWQLRDYVADVASNGFTDYNRNYLRERMREWLPWSVTMQRRGTARVVMDIAKVSSGRTSVHSPERYADYVLEWQQMVENGARCIGDPEQMQALDRMLAEVARRGLERVVVLFPRKPDTLTERGKAETLEPFRAMVEEIAARRGARLVDLTTASPLRSEDFMDDFDHVSAEGNRMFSAWALRNDLAFLQEPPVEAGSQTAGKP